MRDLFDALIRAGWSPPYGLIDRIGETWEPYQWIRPDREEGITGSKKAWLYCIPPDHPGNGCRGYSRPAFVISDLVWDNTVDDYVEAEPMWLRPTQ